MFHKGIHHSQRADDDLIYFVSNLFGIFSHLGNIAKNKCRVEQGHAQKNDEDEKSNGERNIQNIQ